jgi:hypothetical protein
VAEESFTLLWHEPSVTSDDYPRSGANGGPGVAGSFTFTPDRAGVTSYLYRFGDEPERTVAAGPDGTATVSWKPGSYPDADFGYVTLRVRQHIGTIASVAVAYEFGLASLEPTVTVESGTGSGAPWTFRLSSPLAGVSEYTHVIGDVTRAGAGADGAATFTYTPQETGDLYVRSRARTAAGVTSGLKSASFWVSDADK